jgi:formylglycine-generating enzyme required for sulfatase activity
MPDTAPDPKTATLPYEALEAAWLAWRPGAEAPRWQEFLPGPGQVVGPEAVFLLLQLDIEFRAKAGLPGLLHEQYFQHPRLSKQDARLEPDRQAELVRWEYQHRWKRGRRACRGDYLAQLRALARPLGELQVRWDCPRCDHKGIVLEDDQAEQVHCPGCQTGYAVADLFPLFPWAGPAAEATVQDGVGDLGRYAFVEQVGAGGMGVILRVHEPVLNRDLALKVLRAEHRGNADLVRRFSEEAQIAGQLQHPGVVPVHELGRLPDGRPFFTMKLVKGQTLAALLRERAGPAEGLPRFLAIFAQVCQALAYAHARRVIHRDLKPGNVMVGAFGEVQIMDWGLAKVLLTASDRPTAEESARTREAVSVIETLGSAAGEQATQAGWVLGTLAYMPPEQARGEVEQIDERCDVFGLGAILCEILTAQPPYVGTPTQVRAKAREGRVQAAYQRLDGCGADGELAALTKACLAADREGRPRDAGAVAAAVGAYVQGVQERLRAAEVEGAAAAARAESERHRRRLAVVLLAVVVLAAIGLVGGGIWFTMQLNEGLEKQKNHAASEARLRGEADGKRVEAEKRKAEADAALEEVGRQKGVAEQRAKELAVVTAHLAAVMNYAAVWQPDWKRVPGAKVIADASKRLFYDKIDVIRAGTRYRFLLISLQQKDSKRIPTFCIMEYKVSVGQFRLFAGEDARTGPGKVRSNAWQEPDGVGGDYPKDEYPVFNVSLDGAFRCARWLNGNLPTVDQWDKAAGRFENPRVFEGPFIGLWNNLDSSGIAVNRGNKGPMPCGSSTRDVSPFGCRDMAGNGREWTRNLVEAGKFVPLANPAGNPLVVLRGRTFRGHSQPLRFRDLDHPDVGLYSGGDAETGFRVVIEP